MNRVPITALVSFAALTGLAACTPPPPSAEPAAAAGQPSEAVSPSRQELREETPAGPARPSTADSRVSAAAAPASPAAPARVAQAPAPAPRAAARARPAGGDWLQFRGPHGLGVSADPGVPTAWSATEGIVWKTPLPGPGTATPIISRDRIFVTAYTGGPAEGGSADDVKRHLICLDRASGKQLWMSTIPGRPGEQARIREDHGYASNTPVADGERVYAFFGRAGVYAYDYSGKQLWKADVGDRAHEWGSGTSPVLYQDLLIINASVESESLVALDRRTGREVWRAPGIKESWNTPILVTLPGGKQELAVAIFRSVLGFDPQTGEKLWNCDTGINWYMVPSLVAQGDTLYCIGGRGGGGSLAIRAGGRGDVTATHRLWSNQKGSNVPSPILHEGRLYFVRDSPAVAFCLDAKTGNPLYEERLPGADQVYASPVLAGGNLYYLARNGRTFLVPAKPAFQVAATNDLGERGVYDSSPAVAGGRLYIRSKSALYCIGK